MAEIWLLVREGAGAGSEHALEGPLTIGRERADLVLDDDGISRSHARVTPEGGAAAIEDLGSSNGTFVNGERVQRAELWPGDRVQLGGTVIEVSASDAATQMMGAGAGAAPTAEHPGPARPTAPPPPRDPGPPPQPQAMREQPRAMGDPMEDSNLPALFAIFLGPLSIFLLVFSTGAAFFISLPCAIAAIVCGSIGKRKVDRGETHHYRGLATAGQVFGVVGTVLSGLALVVFFLLSVLLDAGINSLNDLDLAQLVDELREELENQGVDVPEQ